jgi:hypothetical protein
MRIAHKAVKFAPNGDASALCSDKPRAINMRSATWVLRDEAVTCKRCLAKLKQLLAEQKSQEA